MKQQFRVQAGSGSAGGGPKRQFVSGVQMPNKLKMPPGKNALTWEVPTEGRNPIGKTLNIGFSAGWAMLGLIWIIRLGTIHSSVWKNPNFEYLLGTWIGQPLMPVTFLIGMWLHSFAGMIFAFPYAWLFEYRLRRVSAKLGVYIGMVHALITGVLLLAVPYVHPGIPRYVQEPGVFMSNLGIGGVVGWFASHALYGFLVGYRWRRIISGAGYPEPKR